VLPFLKIILERLKELRVDWNDSSNPRLGCLCPNGDLETVHVEVSDSQAEQLALRMPVYSSIEKIAMLRFRKNRLRHFAVKATAEKIAPTLLDQGTSGFIGDMRVRHRRERVRRDMALAL
jgi:hypothetical protein